LWDEVTHDGIPGTSLGFAVLGEPVVDGVPWWFVMHGASTVLGLAGWAWASVHIARRGLLREWHGPPPEIVRRPKRFWTVLAGTLAAGSIASALLPDGDVPVVFIIRVLGVFAVAALAAALAVELSGIAHEDGLNRDLPASREPQAPHQRIQDEEPSPTCGPRPNGREARERTR